jgi:hypothetical protein
MTNLEQRARVNANARAWYQRNSKKACESTKKWRAENPEKVKANKTAWLKKPKNRVSHILGQAKQRANKNGMEFSITLDDLLPLPDVCPVLGIKINYEGNKGQRGFVNDSPSIDRLDSSLGYVKGNVKIICWRANRVKSDATVEELRAILNFMEEK